ncbi:hypothetical protein BaRGS_00025541, partial [Batillaria attramentaria]
GDGCRPTGSCPDLIRRGDGGSWLSLSLLHCLWYCGHYRELLLLLMSVVLSLSTPRRKENAINLLPAKAVHENGVRVGERRSERVGHGRGVDGAGARASDYYMNIPLTDPNCSQLPTAVPWSLDNIALETKTVEDLGYGCFVATRARWGGGTGGGVRTVAEVFSSTVAHCGKTVVPTRNSRGSTPVCGVVVTLLTFSLHSNTWHCGLQEKGLVRLLPGWRIQSEHNNHNYALKHLADRRAGYIMSSFCGNSFPSAIGLLLFRAAHVYEVGLHSVEWGLEVGTNFKDEENHLVHDPDDTYQQSPDEDLTKEGSNAADGQHCETEVSRQGQPRAPRVSWFKGDRMLENGEDGRRRPHWILKLIDVTESDTGQYTCVVANRLGRLNYTYSLEVIDQIRSKPKLISQHPQNTTVEYGGTASFQCRVKSIVQPHIKWLKRVEDSEMAQAMNTTIEVKGQKFMVLRTAGEVWSDPDGSYLNKLVIHHASADDAGMYICLGANSMGYSFRAAYLHVVPGEY